MIFSNAKAHSKNRMAPADLVCYSLLLADTGGVSATIINQGAKNHHSLCELDKAGKCENLILRPGIAPTEPQFPSNISVADSFELFVGDHSMTVLQVNVQGYVFGIVLE